MSRDVAVRPPRTMLELYKSLPEGTNVQLIENNLVMSPAPSDIHQEVIDKVYRRLGNYVEQYDLGKTRVAPYDVYFDEENIFQPDIIFISNENLNKIEDDGLHGVPDLVMEILSPRSEKDDTGRKKNVYQRYGVKEYWIVDPSTKHVEGFSLVDEMFVSISSETGIIRSGLLNTEIVF